MTYPSPGRLRMISANVTSPALRIKSLRSYWYGQTRQKKRAVDQGKRRFDFRETLCCPSNILPNKKGKREKKGSRRTSIQKEKGGVGPKANTNRPNGNNKRGPSKIESHFVTLVFIIPLLFCGPIAMIRTCQLVPLGISSTKRR